MVRPGRHDDAKPTLDRAQQAAAAGVVGVLSKKLDSPRHPEPDRRLDAWDEVFQRIGRMREQCCLAIGLGRAEAKRL
jgi:hypothetical protein